MTWPNIDGNKESLGLGNIWKVKGFLAWSSEVHSVIQAYTALIGCIVQGWCVLGTDSGMFLKASDILFLLSRDMRDALEPWKVDSILFFFFSWSCEQLSFLGVPSELQRVLLPEQIISTHRRFLKLCSIFNTWSVITEMKSHSWLTGIFPRGTVKKLGPREQKLVALAF